MPLIDSSQPCAADAALSAAASAILVAPPREESASVGAAFVAGVFVGMLVVGVTAYPYHRRRQGYKALILKRLESTWQDLACHKDHYTRQEDRDARSRSLRALNHTIQMIKHQL